MNSRQDTVAGAADAPAHTGTPSRAGNALDHFFGLTASGTSLRTEVMAGLATFLAGMYIIVVNPGILSDAGIPFSAGLTATVLISFLGSLAMGLYARNPILVAPGMGMNALFTYTLVEGAGVPLETALGCVFWSGVIFVILAVFNVRKVIVDAIPANMRYAITCGIGLFITFIGLKNAGFIVSNPATLVSMADLGPAVLTFLAGLALTSAFVSRSLPGALVLGVVATTLLALPLGRLWGGDAPVVAWDGLFAAPDFSFMFQVDVIGALSVAYWPFIFVMLFTNFFDALSCFMGLSEAADLKDSDGNPRNLKQSMTVDAFASIIAAPLGTSAAQTFIESGAGVAQGGRTGLVAVTVAVLFLPFLFLSPLLELVPAIATSTVLVLVGLFMLAPVSKVEWQRYDEAIPAFLAVILMPLTYSITMGIAYGFLSYVVIKALMGRIRDVKPAMLIVAGLCILMLATV